MKIISLNVNDFGGAQNHLMEFKKRNYKGEEVIDWDRWKQVDKSEPSKGIFSYIESSNPAIAILQEFELNNSKESYAFISWMDKIGYKMIGNIPAYQASMTVMFMNQEIKYDVMRMGGSRNGRHYAIKAGEYIIGGVHIPPSYDEAYWRGIIAFYERWKEGKVMLIGDFNTFIDGTKNKEKFNELMMQGAIDVWTAQGGPNETPTEKRYGGRLDYAIVSPKMYGAVVSMKIHGDIMEENMSDHAALMITLQ